MGIVLKENKTFSDPYDGEITTAYGNIKQLEIDYLSKSASFRLRIYRDADYKTKRPISEQQYTINGVDFDEYIGLDVQDEGNNIIKQCYLWLSQITKSEIEMLEEQDDTLLFDDWQSDEV